MTKKIRPYNEGDLFAVPLKGGGYAIGLLARAKWARTHCDTLGYFFGPRRELVPNADEVGKVTVGDAILVQNFGDLGLHEKEWLVIGPMLGWQREDWPVPIFGVGRVGEVGVENPEAFGAEEHFDQENHREYCFREVSNWGQVRLFPPAGCFGSGAIEHLIDLILSNPPLREFSGGYKLPSVIKPSRGGADKS